MVKQKASVCHRRPDKGSKEAKTMAVYFTTLLLDHEADDAPRDVNELLQLLPIRKLDHLRGKRYKREKREKREREKERWRSDKCKESLPDAVVVWLRSNTRTIVLSSFVRPLKKHGKRGSCLKPTVIVAVA